MPPSVGAFLLFLFIFSFSFLSGERKENQKRKPGTRLGWPAAPVRRRNAHSPQKLFFGAFLRSFSFCERKRTKKKAQEPAPETAAAFARQRNALSPQKIFCGAFLSEKPRREKQKAYVGSGPPDCFRSSPSPLRFLFFGSFFSFPERKERTGKNPNGKKGGAKSPQARAGGAGLWDMRPPVCGMRPLTR